jgi:hypothetical protein
LYRNNPQEESKDKEENDEQPVEEPNVDRKSIFIKLLLKCVYSLDLTICDGSLKFLLFKDEDLGVNIYLAKKLYPTFFTEW